MCVVFGCLNSGFVEMKCARSDWLVWLQIILMVSQRERTPACGVVQIGGGEIVIMMFICDTYCENAKRQSLCELGLVIIEL